MYQENQPLVPSLNSSSNCFSVNALLPTMRIALMRADSPSSTASVMPTRLRSSGVTVEVIFTAYLPRLRYWRLSSCSARSSTARSKIRLSASPLSRNARLTVSSSNSVVPVMDTDAIAGRSSTSTTSTSPCTSRRTSLKKPVANSARTAAAALSSVSSSPTLIGR